MKNSKPKDTAKSEPTAKAAPQSKAEPEEEYFVYMLRCSDGSLYTGITNDIEKRIKTHNMGKASKYTRSRLPVEMVYREAVIGKSAALSRELEIKKLNRETKLKMLKV